MHDFKDYLEKNGFTVFKIPVPSPSPKAEEFLDLCEKNECGMYGTNWGCPPAIAPISEIAESLKSYSTAFLIQKRYELDVKDKVVLKEAVNDIADYVRNAMNMIRVSRRVMALGDGGCNYCGICSYPDDECRFPAQKMDSVSGYGLDMEEILGQIGEKFVFENDAVTFNALIFVE